MKPLSFYTASGDHFPPGLMRLEYQSEVDGFDDWALLLPGKIASAWIIVLHGHGATGDQLYTRQDIRQAWLPNFLVSGAGILTVNLRGNAWMSPAAATDLHELLQWMRIEYGLEQTLFYSGSMGGSSNLIYAALYPEDVNALVALGAATDIGSYYSWCLQQSLGIAHEIAIAIKDAYGGEPDAQKVLFKQHSALQNTSKLIMPVYLAHGAADVLIPVEQARELAKAMQDQKYFYYHEIPDGNHDSPAWDGRSWDFVNQHFS
ncbi:MAG: alpha/beta hydrolase [Abditibacteriaceae bacterium]